MKLIADVAAGLGLSQDDLIPYGRSKAKVPLATLDGPGEPGKLVLVTAMTPTPAGEGKTTTTIGLVQALDRLGEKVAAALREPSLGPCFGIKGGGTGGGKSTLVPTTDINLHFTGDLHAVTAAHNLIAALLDNHVHFGLSPKIDPRRVVWKRVMDQNDRSLRQVILGLGGVTQGVPRESGFDITAASEVMAMLCLARSEEDLRERLARTIVGFTADREPVTVDDLQATGAALALLKDALLPNLVQTAEGTPAFVHGGPFANIAHGCNSVLATRMAMKLADWTVTEAGFGSDLGAEKFFHIACPAGDFDPSVVVMVATVRALKYHGGVALKSLENEDCDAVRAGFANLEAHLDNIRAFGKPVVVAINRFTSDTDAEVGVVLAECAALGVRAAASSHFAHGGAGAEDLARLVMDAADAPLTPAITAYSEADSLEQKLKNIAKRVYGAEDLILTKAARAGVRRFERLGMADLPVCMAKTQSSLSGNPARRGRPTGFTVEVRALRLSAGAGFIVALTGDIVRMPGLPRKPSAAAVDVVDGHIVGVG
ncbi:MAG: formate--tetrahydrofolate ligase [Proteobacteria bacterium]|nr:formate--tetrahydrofolate ligase [Pseudomonadota bacterium]